MKLRDTEHNRDRLSQLRTGARTYRIAAQIVPHDATNGGLNVRELFRQYADAKDAEARELEDEMKSAERPARGYDPDTECPAHGASCPRSCAI